MQSGPSAPVAGLPVMSELLRRVADLDEEEADMLRSLGTAKAQVRLCMQPQIEARLLMIPPMHAVFHLLFAP